MQDLVPVDYRIEHVRKQGWRDKTNRRAAVDAYIAQNHYMLSSGGSGQVFAIFDQIGTIHGACKIGPTASEGASRAIVNSGVTIRQTKRTHILDSCPVPESRLMRWAMQSIADEYGIPLVVVSYTDPAARDIRYDKPLLGGCYLAAGCFYIGLTSQPRYGVVDEHGRARSTRQGKITLTRKTLPSGWEMVKLPPARVWIAVVCPRHVTIKGVTIKTTRKWRKQHYLGIWANLAPQRRVAARRWIEEHEWRRMLNDGTIAIGEPDAYSGTNRRQAALFNGDQMTRTASPVWVPYEWQADMIDLADVIEERTAGRSYLPIQIARERRRTHEAALV